MIEESREAVTWAEGDDIYAKMIKQVWDDALGLMLIMYLFGVKLGILPTIGNATWRHYLMPPFTLSVFSMAFITRM